LAGHGAEFGGDTDGECLLAYAADANLEPVANYLLGRGAKQSETQAALAGAVENDNVRLVRKLLSSGASVRGANADGSSLIVIVQSAEMARFLLRLGANVAGRQTRGKYQGFTGLHYAATNGNLALIRVLISNGADVNATVDGTTPLTRAATYAGVPTLELLMAHGAKVDVTGSRAWTALMCAAEEGLDLNVDCLLQHGANPNACDSDGYTPLMLAAQNGNDAAVQDLLESGARVNASNEAGETALDLTDGNKPVTRLLKQWGGRPGKTVH